MQQVKKFEAAPEQIMAVEKNSQSRDVPQMATKSMTCNGLQIHIVRAFQYCNTARWDIQSY